METPRRVCVKCDHVLDRGTYAGVEVDLCPACGGLWLDRGELERLNKGARPEVDRLRKTLVEDRQLALASSDLPTACPACPGKLREVVVAPIKIDFCAKCGGLWLDRGELDAVLEAAGGEDLGAMLQFVAEMAQTQA